MEVARSRKRIVVSQRKYTLDFLKETGMHRCKHTPMEANCKLGHKNESSPVDTGRYQRLVDKLIYLSHIRPDIISFVVTVANQFMKKHNEEHPEAIYRMLRYLTMTPGKGIFFKKGTSRNLEINTDAYSVGFVVVRRSAREYCIYV